MDRDEAIRLLRGAHKGVAEWNRRRGNGEPIPSLIEAQLIRTYLNEADLREADLSGANLEGAWVSYADLRGAQLVGTDLVTAHLVNADLSRANLTGANLSATVVAGAKFIGAQLYETNLTSSCLDETDFTRAECIRTNFAFADLRKVSGLDSVVHRGPSAVDHSALNKSHGRIPKEFLRGCGLQAWEILTARLYDPDLSNIELCDINTQAIHERIKGPLRIGGVFVSYAHEDGNFAEKLRDRLQENDISVWLDKHDAVAGPLRRQVVDAIRVHDVVLLVLSEHSVHSNWVDYELKKALQKEVDEGREVLCPVRLDDAWEAKTKEGSHWQDVREKNVLDFSKWKTKAFDAQFDKLVKGLAIYYERPKAKSAK